MTDGVSEAFNERISITDLIPKDIWELARDITIQHIDNILSMLYQNPESIRNSIKIVYGKELTDIELSFLKYALYHIKQHLLSVIQ